MKKHVVLTMMIVMVAGGIATAAGLGAQGGAGMALREEVRAYRDQAKAYVESKKGEIQQLKTQIQSLKTQLGSTTDPVAKQQIRTQMKGLLQQLGSVLEDMAQHRVEWAQQGVVFAQRRVELAKDQLAKIQAKKSKLENF